MKASNIQDLTDYNVYIKRSDNSIEEIESIQSQNIEDFIAWIKKEKIMEIFEGEELIVGKTEDGYETQVEEGITYSYDLIKLVEYNDKDALAELEEYRLELESAF